MIKERAFGPFVFSWGYFFFCLFVLLGEKREFLFVLELKFDLFFLLICSSTI